MKEEYREERYELAKQLLLQKDNCTPKSAYEMAGELIELMYGVKEESNGKKTEVLSPLKDNVSDEGISICEKDGKKWVRVNIYDEDFLLGIHDIKDGNKDEFEWETAVAAAEKLGYTLPNKKQFSIIAAYLDEINAKMEEAGGEALTKWYWSSARYYSTRAWCFHGYYGRLYDGYLYGGLSCRPLAYL